jgi:predicted dehydrogenase
MTKINIAFIGSGYIQHYHAKGLKKQPDVELSVVADINLDAAKKFAKEYEILETTDDVLSLTKNKNIDAVIISTPNKFHAPYAIEFLKNGKDVFVEKPMAINSEVGEIMAKVADENKQLIMVGHMWRFDVEVNFIKDKIDNGELGKIIKTKGYGIHENWGPTGWFVEKEIAGGGALADMGVHAIDTVRYLLGDPKAKQVYAKIGTYYGDYNVDDTGIIMITWDNGATSIIESGWWQPHMDGPEAATQLFGTKGYASVFPTTVKMPKGDFAGEFKPKMPEREEHCDQIIYTRQMEHFINCIRTRTQPKSGFVEGLEVLKIVDAAYQSSETGQAVDV